MVEEDTSEWLAIIAMLHFAAKLILLGLMVQSFRQANNKLSLSFVYVVIGWELQAHLLVVRLFEAGKESMFGFGIFFGMLGWGLTLVSLLVLPRPII